MRRCGSLPAPGISALMPVERAAGYLVYSLGEQPQRRHLADPSAPGGSTGIGIQRHLRQRPAEFRERARHVVAGGDHDQRADALARAPRRRSRRHCRGSRWRAGPASRVPPEPGSTPARWASPRQLGAPPTPVISSCCARPVAEQLQRGLDALCAAGQRDDAVGVRRRRRAGATRAEEPGEPCAHQRQPAISTARPMPPARRAAWRRSLTAAAGASAARSPVRSGSRSPPRRPAAPAALATAPAAALPAASAGPRAGSARRRTGAARRQQLKQHRQRQRAPEPAPPSAASAVARAGEPAGDVAVGGAEPVHDLDRLAPRRRARRGWRPRSPRPRPPPPRAAPRQAQACRLRASTASRCTQTPWLSTSVPGAAASSRAASAASVASAPARCTAITAGSGSAEAAGGIAEPGPQQLVQFGRRSGRARPATPALPRSSGSTPRPAAARRPAARGAAGCGTCTVSAAAAPLLPVPRQRRRADRAGQRQRRQERHRRHQERQHPVGQGAGAARDRRTPTAAARAQASVVRRPAGPGRAAAPAPGWRATSASLCVATTTVVPSRFISFSSCISRSACTSSRLPVGSSASSRLGRATTARAMATRCCSPPDSSGRPRLELPRQPDPAQHLRDVGADLPLRPAGDAQRQRHVVERREMRQQAEILEHHADPPAQRRQRAARRGADIGAEHGQPSPASAARQGTSAAAGWSCRRRTGRAASGTRPSGRVNARSCNTSGPACPPADP